MNQDIKRNNLHYSVDLLRMEGKKHDHEQSETCVTALHNVIRTMRLSRHDKICGEDFSQLNFGNIPMNGINWSIDGEDPCCFDGCRLNEWNFMSGHSGAVTSVAWSHNGKYILTGSCDHTCILWQADTGLMLQKLEGHLGEVVAISFANNDSLGISAAADNMVKIWDLGKGDCLNTIYIPGIILATALMSNKDEYLIISTEYPNCKLKITTQKETFWLSGHTDKIISASISSDGKYCITGSMDATAKIWNISEERCVKTFKVFSESVDSVSFSYDGQTCIMYSGDGTVVVFEKGIKEPVLTIEESSISYGIVAFSPNKEYILTGSLSSDYSTQIFSIRSAENGKCLYKIKMDFDSKIFSAFSKFSIAFSPDGHRCVIGGWNQTTGIWSIRDNKKLLTLRGYFDLANSTIISNNESYCLIETTAGNNYILDLEHSTVYEQNREFIKNEDKYTVGKFGYFCFSNSGKYFFTALPDGRGLLIDTSTGEHKYLINGHSVYIDSAKFSMDETLCTTGSWDKSVVIWSTKTGSILRKFNVVDNGEWQFPYYVVKKFGECIIYKYNCFELKKEIHPILIGDFFIIHELYLKNCSFQNITADETARKILYQYGADIEKPE